MHHKVKFRIFLIRFAHLPYRLANGSLTKEIVETPGLIVTEIGTSIHNPRFS